MTIEGGTTKAACEACRVHRRKCTPECPLAPYFPAGKYREFQNVHNLFGESRIKKMLTKLEPTVKKDYVESIIYHADMWEIYPVNGCLVRIWELQGELETVRQELEIYRQHYRHQHDRHHHQQQLPDQLELGVTPSSNNSGLRLFNQMPQPQDYNNLVAATYLPMSQHQHQHHEAYDNSRYIDSRDGVPNFLGAEHL